MTDWKLGQYVRVWRGGSLGEDVDERIASMAYDLEQVVRKLRATEGQDLDYTKETLVRSGETLEEVQSTLDDCRHILGRVLE